MPLILAIEPDKRQSTQLASLVKGLQAELVQRPNAADGLAALQGRVPDLVLTSSLISPRDDSSLAARLRELGAAAAHVQTVTIPLLGSAPPTPVKGMLAALRREKPQAMTDGCAPEVFADQIRQYLATAEEQKLAAATRVAAEPEAPVEPLAYDAESIEAADPIEAAPFAEVETAPAPEDIPAPFVEFTAPEPLAVVETPVVAEAFEPTVLAPVEAAPFAEAAPIELLETAARAPEPEFAMQPLEEAGEAEEFVLDEPAGLPLSQLLQMVSETAVAEAAVAEAAAEALMATAMVERAEVEVEEPAPIVELADVVELAPVAELADVVEPESLIEPPAAADDSDFDDLYVDPMAAQALEELSHQAAAPPLVEGLAAEAPVPVVEMYSFESLDSIASELAAGPGTPRHESLDDLASLFAASPAPEPAVAPRPAHGEKSLFTSLFAEPPAASLAEPADVADIDPSLFASSPTAPVVEAIPEPVLAAALEPEPEPEPEPVLAATAEPELVDAEPLIEFEHVEFEPVVFEQVQDDSFMAAAGLDEEEIALDVDAFDVALAEPEPVVEPIAAAAPAAPSPFSFTLVDGFGDEWSDFDVHGTGERAPAAPHAASPAAAPGAPRPGANGPQAAPALDEEALSLIGDAARKVSLDAFVIEEFERGFPARRPKKAKKKVHAGATQVTPATELPSKTVKRPVQDEWGMFDPEQCGFAALEDEESAEPRKTTTGTRVRVISY